MPCESCGGRGCAACGLEGRQAVTQADLPDRDTWEVLRWADMAIEGQGWPQAGGVLDQTQWFLDAVRAVRNEVAQWRARRLRQA